MKKQSLFFLFVLVFVSLIRGPIVSSSELTAVYDDLNRLVRLEKAGEYAVEYAYDQVGNRTAKTIMVANPGPDSDGDDDVDGTDLFRFLQNRDQVQENLADFASGFGAEGQTQGE